MKVLVVGGGVVGMVASWLAAKRHSDVTLIEAAGHLGGLLQGPNFDGKSFDHGTHSLATTGIGEIDDFLFSGLPEDGLNIFSGHDADRSGSYSSTGWNEDTSFLDLRGSELVADILDWRSARHQSGEVRSARDELHLLYGDAVVSTFENILRSVFGRNADELDVNAVKLLGLHRAVLMESAAIDASRDREQIDPIIAHPDRQLYRRRPAPDVHSVYPKVRGLGAVLVPLEDKLRDAGVNIMKKADISRCGNTFHVKNSEAELTLEGPAVIWTAGVPAAAKLFLDRRPDIARGDMICWIAHVEVSVRTRELQNHYYFVRHPALRTYRLTNYAAVTCDREDRGYTLELTVHKSLSEPQVRDLVIAEMVALGLIEADEDLVFLQLSRLSYSFLDATAGFSAWCQAAAQELRPEVALFGPWSSPGMFFTGDCLRDLYARLPGLIERA